MTTTKLSPSNCEFVAKDIGKDSGDLPEDGWSEAELIEPFTHGDTNFLTRFVRATMPDYLRRWWGVSDVVQSVILRLHRHRGRWQSGTREQFEAWAVSVAKNRIADGIRRFRLDSRFLNQDCGQRAEHRESSQSRQPNTSVDQEEVKEETERLLAAIQALPTDIQDVVLLRYVDELTFQQIADKLGIPVTSCRRRWQEGCVELGQRLRDCIESRS